MTKLRYTNSNGDSIEFSNTSPFLLQKKSGFGAIKNNLHTYKSPGQDGQTIIDKDLDSREIIIQGTIITDNRSQLEDLKRQLIKTLNPKLSGTLTYINGDFEKIISCEVETAPVFGDETALTQAFDITVLCPSPFWLDNFSTGEEIAVWLGGIVFPFKFPVSFAKRTTTKKNIINTGDVETPVTIKFKGPAANPKIINHSTGEYIQVNRTLSNSDTLIITTDFGNKKINLIDSNGVEINAMHYIDLSSTFLQLQVGDNVIEYTSDNDLIPEGVLVTYSNRYVGI